MSSNKRGDGQTDTGAGIDTLILLLFPNAKWIFKGPLSSGRARRFFCLSQYNGWITVNKMSLVSLVCQLVRQLDTEGLSDLVPHTTPFWGSLIIDFSKENNFASMRQFVFLSIWEIAFEHFCSKWDKFSLAWYLGTFFFSSPLSLKADNKTPKH